MKLSHKVFLYTSLTTSLAGFMIIGYFVFMLPGLHTDYKTDSYMNSVEKMQSTMIHEGTCPPQTEVFETFVSFNLIIPKTGSTLKLCNSYFSTDVTLLDASLNTLLNQIRDLSSSEEREVLENSWDAIDWSPLQNLWETVEVNPLIAFHNVDVLSTFAESENPIQDYRLTQDGSAIISSEVADATNTYVTYVGFTEKNGYLYVSFASAMTPKLAELKPIIMQSVPMIVAFLVLFALVTARLFSKMLAAPIEVLADQASRQHEYDDWVFKQPNQNDEFKVLEDALNRMHQDLKAQNTKLQREKEKQELFLMNASHQLKTPVASASLLVESMIGKVGKFSDTPAYLPKVRYELARMQGILESMVVVFQDKTKQLELETVAVDALIQRIFTHCETKVITKGLHIDYQMESASIETDAEIFASILENLILNAIQYTPHQQTIHVILQADRLILENDGVWISPMLIDHLKEPFVREHSKNETGTGLGLYLVDTFTAMIGQSWTIENGPNGVRVTVYFKGKGV